MRVGTVSAQYNSNINKAQTFGKKPLDPSLQAAAFLDEAARLIRYEQDAKAFTIVKEGQRFCQQFKNNPGVQSIARALENYRQALA